MKHYAVEIDKELTKDQFIKLAAWAAEKKYWEIAINQMMSDGQMIEFLDDSNFMPDITRFSDKEWIVSSGKNPVPEGKIWREPNWFKEELVDALWEATKDILNRD